jgi:cytoskeleton protein RodZ
MPDLVALREGKGLSLADVFAKTRISTRNLAALEQGDFSTLPPPVYAKAFIRQYANLIEIDPQSILLKYESYLKAQEDPRPARKSEGSKRPPQGRRFGKTMGAILGILVVMATLSFFLFSPDGKQPDRSAKESISPNAGNQTFTLDTTTPAAAPSAKPLTTPETATPAPATPQPATPVTVTPTVPTNPLPPPPQAANTLGGIPTGSQKLTIQARESTWVGIRIDQQEGQQVYLHPGDAVTYTGNQFRMNIGNAGGIDLFLQGKPLPSLGERGQVVHVTLP